MSWVNFEEIESFEQNAYENEIIESETRLFMYSGGTCVIKIPLKEFEVLYFTWDDQMIKENQITKSILN